MVSITLLYLAAGKVTIDMITERLAWPISRSGYWFIMVYALLMLLSPILNAGLKTMTKRQITVITVLLTIYCIYGAHWGDNYTNTGGYTITQAIWLYVTAHWLRLYSDKLSGINKYWFLSCFGIVSILFMVCLNYSILPNKVFQYNSLLTFVSSLSIFLFFTRLKFRSSLVNSIAPAAFGCYMIQDGVLGHEFLYAEIRRIFMELRDTLDSPESLVYRMGFFAALIVGYWCLSIVLTPVADRLSRYAGDFVEYVGRRLGKLRP